MRQILYVSSATPEFDEGDLARILEASRRKNSRVEVTGMLLYAEGVFFQVLEGPEDAVQALFNRLAGDPRHTGVITMMSRYITARDFPNWSMGFEKRSTLEELPPAFFELSAKALENKVAGSSSVEVVTLLRTFARTTFAATA
ncbi:BLUF domain-containing protein [Parvularcula sp. LCG005]|uniref:BLUF domain-containing protein n=1 Tax=Parvularcula sp. LCG005 TaxID=3078805 RepID=UPI002942DACB|nr:BLUF domain-containing protein [Parvularcula sp. LCG005]WOI52371.1 BLUF domain-containing protein [Parvularcula sp. LCG005]